MIVKDRKGFTMVEMIIVLVILAIVTAIAIPVTLGIIDDNKETEAKQMAKTIMTAVQSEFNKLAANEEQWCSDQVSKGLILNKDRRSHGTSEYKQEVFKNGFVSIEDTDAVDDIFKKIDNAEDIYMLYVGAGKVYEYYYGDDRQKMYTCYVIAYQLKDENQPVYFYDGKTISTEWPFTTPGINDTQDGQNFKLSSKSDTILQMYALRSKGTNCYDFWTKKVISAVKNN